jgi:hypothetical protein
MVGESCNRSKLRTKFQTVKASQKKSNFQNGSYYSIEGEEEQDNKELLSKHKVLEGLLALEKSVTF